MKKKYNFIPEHQIKSSTESSSEFSVSINKMMNLYISPFDVGIWNLDKKIVRFYADLENKTIAWKEITGGSMGDLQNVRQLSINKESGAILVGLTRLLKSMGVTKEMLPFKKIPVTKYKDSQIEGELNVIDLKDYAKINKKDGE